MSKYSRQSYHNAILSDISNIKLFYSDKNPSLEPYINYKGLILNNCFQFLRLKDKGIAIPRKFCKSITVQFDNLNIILFFFYFWKIFCIFFIKIKRKKNIFS